MTCCKWTLILHSRQISPSRTRELLIEVKDPALQNDNVEGHSHLFCIVSVRDLLTTSNQKHIIPLLSFCRTSRATDESLTSLEQHHVSDIEELSESRTVAEKSAFHYRYSNIITCHRNNSNANKQSMGQAFRPNIIEATVTIQVTILENRYYQDQGKIDIIKSYIFLKNFLHL